MTRPPGWFEEGALVSVLTTQPIDRFLDYKAPPGGCAAGAFVEVPLGPRRVMGVVWGPGGGGFDPARIRGVHSVWDVPPMREEMQRFLERAAEYTLTPLSHMLRLATRAPGIGAPPAKRRVLRKGAHLPERMTDARRRVLAVFDEFGGGVSLTPTEVQRLAGVSGSVVRGLVEAGALVEEAAPRDLPFPPLDTELPGKALSPGQATAAETLRAAIARGGFGVTLLRGVTGSGKTEVYLEAVAAAVREGRQALVLLPEIALTADFLRRVEARFGVRPAEWHSGLTQTERRRVWRMVAEGNAELVVGARSALFLPFRDLGLVVVDEEHDTSYKQEDGALYNARDMAVLRASIAGAEVILASATPSVESWVNAQTGKYRRLDLPDRFGEAEMPDMHAIDMRAERLPRGRWISETLAGAVRSRIERGEQSLLFLNRRGYAPVTVCRACGHQIGCEHCDARMVEHRFQKRLMCHQCGETRPIPTACPSCGAEEALAAVGPGVERVAEEAAALFPGARLAILSSDVFPSARALREAIAGIAEGGADIIIGTQLVAKGHNFPLLTLVGVIDADLGLQGTDLRAAERTYQLVRQVAGRAGRAARRGTALIQTFQPEHPVIRAILAGDDERFLNAEAAERRQAGMPPFGRLAGVIVSGPDLAAVMDVAGRLAREAAPLAAVGAQVFGPAPAPIARIRGRHRVRLLVKAPRTPALQGAIRKWLAPLRLPANLRVTVDIDPQSFY